MSLALYDCLYKCLQALVTLRAGLRDQVLYTPQDVQGSQQYTSRNVNNTALNSTFWLYRSQLQYAVYDGICTPKELRQYSSGEVPRSVYDYYGYYYSYYYNYGWDYAYRQQDCHSALMGGPLNGTCSGPNKALYQVLETARRLPGLTDNNTFSVFVPLLAQSRRQVRTAFCLRCI